MNFTLEIDTYNRHNLDDPSSVQDFRDGQNIQKRLLSGISFFSPIATPPPRSSGPPPITSFSASSQVAGSGVNSAVTFSWTTQNVDYVQLHYTCVAGLTVLDGGTPQCGSYPPSPNYSPQASRAITFGNFITTFPDRPSIPVTVTLEPFADGVGYPNLSKSLTIAVSPYNPFPEGVPTSNRNMRIILAAGTNGEFSFPRGSSMKIQWLDTNTAPPDPCVNLYLVRDDNSGGELYLYQLSKSCLTPASGGSYSWTIPSNFAGSGFWILGAAPGVRANALSAAFTIR